MTIARQIVVVVGGEGALADAVKRRLLASDYEVRHVQRGEDVIAPIAGAHAVVILVAASLPAFPSAARAYAKAAAAVAHGLAGASRRAVIAVTTVPAYHRRRDKAQEAYERAERALRDAGASALVLRTCGLLGTPETPAAGDRFLTATGRRRSVSLPGEATHLWAPVTVEDAARVVADAVAMQPRDATYALRGPESEAVIDIARAINNGDERYRHRRDLVWRLSAARHYVPDQELTLSAEPSAADRLAIPVSSASAAWTPSAIKRRDALAATKQQAVAFQGESFATRVGGGLAAGFLFIAGLVLAVIGIFDLLAWPEDAAVRLIALMLALAGGLALVGSLALLNAWPRRFVIAFLGAIGVAAVSVAFILAWIVSGGGYLAALAVAFALVVIAAIVAAALWSRSGMAVTDFLRRGAPAFLTSVLTVGTLIGLGQFWYQNVFLPNQRFPVINIVSAMSQENARGVIKVTITLRNPTATDIVIVASHYDVMSYRAPVSQSGLTDRDRPFGRHQPLVQAGVLRSGEVTAPAIQLAPNGEVTRELVVQPSTRDAAAVLNVRLVTMDPRLQQVALDVRPPRADAAARVVQRQITIFEESLWRSLTRGDRVIYTTETLEAGSKWTPCGEIDRLDAYVARREREIDFREATYPPCRADEFLFDSYYGLSSEEATSELALRSTRAR